MFAISAGIGAVGQHLGLFPPRKPERVVFKGVMQPIFFKRDTWDQFKVCTLTSVVVTDVCVCVQMRTDAYRCACVYMRVQMGAPNTTILASAIEESPRF